MLAYLIGAYLGDGRTAGEEDKKVRFKVADVAFAKLLNHVVANVLAREPKVLIIEDEFFCVNYDSAALYDFLQQPLEKQMPLIERFPTLFLRGFFDAEGYASCSVDPKRKTVKNFIVGAANTEMDYLSLAKRLLKDLEIHSSVRRTNKAGGRMTIRGRTWFRKHDVYHVVVTRRDDFRRFYQVVGFHNPSKAKKLRDLVEMAEMPPNKRHDWFRLRYRKEGRRWVRLKMEK